MMRRSCCGLALLLLVGGCGDDDEVHGSVNADPPASTTPPTYDGEASLPDPGGVPGVLDVAAALGEADGSDVNVAGHLIALPDGTAELCGGPIQESAPPQCGDPSLPVDGLADPASIPGTTDVGGWVEGDVVLTGTIGDGRLDVA